MERYIPIGKTLGTLGFHGSLKIFIEENYMKSYHDSVHIFLEDSPTPLPFFIAKRSEKETLIVQLDELPTKEEAVLWTSKKIFLRDFDIHPDEANTPQPVDNLSDLDNFALFNLDTEIGTILRLEEYPEQIMAIVSIDGKESMIPLHSDLIIDIDYENKKMTMELPEGLLDL